MAIVAVGVAFFLGRSDNRHVWITEVRTSDFRLYLHASNCACTSKVASFPGPAHTEKQGEPGIFSHMGAVGAINQEPKLPMTLGPVFIVSRYYQVASVGWLCLRAQTGKWVDIWSIWSILPQKGAHNFKSSLIQFSVCISVASHKWTSADVIRIF